MLQRARCTWMVFFVTWRAAVCCSHPLPTPIREAGTVLFTSGAYTRALPAIAQLLAVTATGSLGPILTQSTPPSAEPHAFEKKLRNCCFCFVAAALARCLFAARAASTSAARVSSSSAAAARYSSASSWSPFIDRALPLRNTACTHIQTCRPSVSPLTSLSTGLFCG